MRPSYLTMIAVCAAAFWTGAASAEETGMEAHREALKSSYWPDRYRAVEALGKSSAHGAIEILEAALKDKEPYVRLRAVQSLGEIGSAVAEKALRTALKDAKALVREAAAEELAKLVRRRITEAREAAAKREIAEAREAALRTRRAKKEVENILLLFCGHLAVASQVCGEGMRRIIEPLVAVVGTIAVAAAH